MFTVSTRVNIFHVLMFNQNHMFDINDYNDIDTIFITKLMFLKKNPKERILQIFLGVW